MMDEEKETPQEVASIILPQFLLPVGPLELLPGTHLQVNLPLDGSHLPPGIPSDSALTCLPGLLPQEGSVLPVSKGLAAPAAVQSVHPKKEEEEPVEIDLYWRGGAGRWQEEEEEEEKKEVCADRVSDRRKFYEVEVELPDFDFNTETLTAPALSDETKAFEAPDPAHKRPEFISLNSWSFNLFRGGASHSPAGGRGLVCLLQALRRTVLPAHWVAVLADRPELQLLQCSKLSSMTDTIVHVQPDRSFYISIQNQRLPETHRVFEAHTHRVSHLSQLVSLLLHLEQLVVCRGSRVRSSACQRVQSPACHLLVAPPLRTCLSCLLEEGSEEEESEEEEEDEDETTVMRPS
ncbi:uncharacterized protein LOC108228462 [Kryptolebias marmoratus]|uniref:uncharacterized protein LOC108228462 n=1 Tax=Kryptolebias marmoratus TaxID=37003 RepID=UPI0007F89BDB|nr:uncharacterized protein LOC108228462 [Kryptolebias marmoratus]